VLMPFREEFDDVYLVIRDAVSVASESLGMEIRCRRADEIAKPGRITEQILHEIESADLLIADLSGNNPNVMYELGYGHALEKTAIIINQDVHTSPFDVKDFRQVLYDRNRLVKDCRPSLVAAIRDVFGTEPVTESEGTSSEEPTQETETGSPESSAATAPLRPGRNAVAVLQALHLRMQVANAKNSPNEVRAVADEVRALLARITVASGAEKSDVNNTAAVAGNCAVEMEKAELHDHAETVYRRALGLFPDYPGLHMQYCDFLIDGGKFDEARQELERAKALHRDETDLRRIKRLEVKLSLKTGAQSQELASDLKEQFEKSPGDRLAAGAYLLYLAQSEAPLGVFESVCERWKTEAPEDQKWQADRALADHLASTRDRSQIERAIEIYESLLEWPDQPEDDRVAVLHNVAQLYAQIGNKDRSRLRWGEAYKLRPTDPAIRAMFSQRLASWGQIDDAMIVAEGKPLSG